MQIRLNSVRDVPRLELIDALGEGLDEQGLRARARDSLPAAGVGYVSRSYSFPYALVGRHRDRVGVDIERTEPCEERFGRSICTPAEAELTPWRGDGEIIRLWSAKEALAKALGDAVLYDPRRLESPAAWRHGACGGWRALPVPVPDGYCAWVCWWA